MPKSKLTKRQLAVIEDLFAAELEEEVVLEKHKVKPAIYDRWLADERFAAALELRIARSYRAGQIVLARNAVRAASKLVALTECEKEETVRKTCLDIITMQTTSSKRPAKDTRHEPETRKETTLPPETASRILAVLAESKSEE